MSNEETIFETAPETELVEESIEQAPETSFQVNDKVWVPAKLVSEEEALFTWTHRRIVSIDGGTIRVDGQMLPPFRASRARKDLGVLVVTAGDFASEFATLVRQPKLAKDSR